MTPAAETATRLIAESAVMFANGERIFLKSHTLTVLSSDPETTLSSLVNTAEVTVLK